MRFPIKVIVVDAKHTHYGEKVWIIEKEGKRYYYSLSKLGETEGYLLWRQFRVFTL